MKIWRLLGRTGVRNGVAQQRAGEDHKTNLATKTTAKTNAAAAERVAIRKVKFSFTVSQKERHMVS